MKLKEYIARQEATDLLKFLKMVDPDKCDVFAVSYMKNVLAYLNKLRNCKVGPSGQISKLTTLLSAIRMLVGMKGRA